MRLALVQQSDFGPWERFKQLGNLTTAFRRLDHDAGVLAPATAGVDDLATPASMGELTDARFWRRQEVDGVIAVTWLHQARVLGAAKAAGLPTIALADSDGIVVPWHDANAMAQRARIAAERFVAARRGRGSGVPGLARAPTPPGFAEPPAEGLRDRLALRSRLGAALAAADWTGFQGQPALDRYVRTLDRLGIAVPAGRVGISEQTAAAHFSHAPLDASRTREVVAIGRWSDPQKGSRLLAAVVDRLLRADGHLSLTVIGAGAHGVVAAHPRVRRIEAVPSDELPAVLAGAGALLSTSRLEGAPVAFSEALACGCPVVGPPLPAVEHIAAADVGGWMAPRHVAGDLVRATIDALDASADPAFGTRVAAYWRSRVDAEIVAAALADRITRARR